MEENSKIRSISDIKELTIEIQRNFSCKTDKNEKWLLLKDYHSYILQVKEYDKNITTSYATILSTLLDVLQPNLFTEKWQEVLFDEVFISGIPHEAFLILVKRLSQCTKYALQIIIRLLAMFSKSSMESLFIYQCASHKDWDIKYISMSNYWNELITAIVSVPERVANRTTGDIPKVLRPRFYMPLLLSTVVKVLRVIHSWLSDSQDCSLEFLAKLTGRISILGYADRAATAITRELRKQSKSDFLWRRIFQNFIVKMPSNAFDSFIPSLLLKSRWYGYVEWILGDEGVKNEKINYIMTVKLFFFRPQKTPIFQNAIGYFASSPSRVPHFKKILNSLLDSWIDQRAYKLQSQTQQLYIASTLMVCAGWIKKLKLEFDKKEFLGKILEGTQMRLGNSKEEIRSIGMIVGEYLIKAVDPDMPPLKFEHNDLEFVYRLISLMEIPPNPASTSFSAEDLKCFEEVQSENMNEKKSKNDADCNASNLNEEFESDDDDDDIEPFDMSHDVPQSELKRPLYLRDCMAGLLDQENTEWAEKCMKHAEELIKTNPYAATEIAEEMAKIVLHLRDNSSIDNFVALRRRILIALTVQCPIIVSNYLISQFSEKDYTIQQRLDVLDVLAASSAALSFSTLSLQAAETQASSSKQGPIKKGPDWQLIVDKRLEANTKRYTKAQELVTKENKFSAVAGNFFFPLLNSYERACKVLKLHGNDSYVLGRLVYTLGIIMCSASNTVHCRQMGITLLQFLCTLRSHEDVFVRQSVIFAVAATITAVPSTILFSEMLPDVTEITEWLQSVVEKDPDTDCVEKSLYTLSIFQSAASEGSLLYQLRNLAIS